MHIYTTTHDVCYYADCRMPKRLSVITYGLHTATELNCDSVNLFDKLENIYSSCLSNSGSAAKEENGSTTTTYFWWWGGIHYIVITETNVTNIFKMVQHDKICYYCALLHFSLQQEWNEEAAATIWLVIKYIVEGGWKKKSTVKW